MGMPEPATSPASTAHLTVTHFHDRSVQSRLVALSTATVVRPLFSRGPLNGLGMGALGWIERAFNLVPPPREARVTPIRELEFRGEWVNSDEPWRDGSGKVVLYMHGGAFLFCGVGTHRRVVARIARLSGANVLSVSYRQCPEVTVPGSIADCVAAYRWLLAQGYAAGDIVFAGDSAGGHLVFATALAALRLGLPAPAALAAMSPWLDFDDTARLAHRNVRRDPFLPAHRIADLKTLVLAGLDITDPSHSPVNADLSGLPPVLIQVAESEVLVPDAELMAERLAAARVPVTLQFWHGQIHAFPVLAGLTPESAAATRHIADFIALHTARSALRTA